MALSKSTRIKVMIGIDTAFFLLELIIGIIVHSLALTADAFHMLNDIISLVVGLYAVDVAKRGPTNEFTFGWVRAEILGAFFNAVFLIALCVSIILEAITRFVEPPEINNPKLILIVGCAGLLSNFVGFLVLSGHSHSRAGKGEKGAEGHTDIHIQDIEEGITSREKAADQDGRIGAVLPDSTQRQFCEGRRSSEGEIARFARLDDMSIHPSGRRSDIIAAGRSCSTDVALGSDAISTQAKSRVRRDSGVHHGHNHSLPKEPSKGAGHNHQDLGMKAMVLHVIGDGIGNVGVIITALIIWLTNLPGKFYTDPAVSLVIAAIILRTSIPLTRATSRILLQATPANISISDIRQDIERLPDVVSCHHIHVWQLSDTKVVASMHLQVSYPINTESGDKYIRLAKSARKCLHAYGIHSATIQPEFCLIPEQLHDEKNSGLIPRRATQATDACLVNCVKDCEAQGCCSTTDTAL